MEQNLPLTTPHHRDRYSADRSYWPAWNAVLKRWGVGDFAATLLEAAGPLSIFIAQFIYIGQPFLQGSSSGVQIRALANMLDDQQEAQLFATFLREEESQ